MLPNFIIAGAAKSGTTSLYYYLDQHPLITFPALKEPKYFSSINKNFPQAGPGDWSIDKYMIKTRENYEKLYKDLNNLYVGDASPDYLFYANTTTKEIKNFLGDIPIIIILRNPVDRAYSAFNYLVRDGRESHDFLTALSLEEERRDNNYDFMWSYIKAGLYSDQVQKFLDTFSKVKIIILEEFKKDPNLILNEILLFLGIDQPFEFKTATQHNISGLPTNVIIQFLLSRKNIFSVFFREFVKSTIPRSFLESLSKKVIKQQSLKSQDRLALMKLFKDDIAMLEQFIGFTIPSWQEKSK